MTIQAANITFSLFGDSSVRIKTLKAMLEKLKENSSTWWVSQKRVSLCVSSLTAISARKANARYLKTSNRSSAL